MHDIIGRLDEIEASTPGLSGRHDKTRIAAAGHSMGGHTVAMLAGMQVTDPLTGEMVNLSEPRIKSTVMFGTPGNGADTADFAREHYAVITGTDFSSMTMPALVVAGDQDFNARFSARQDWRMDAYYSSPGPKCLLTVFGSGHMLGGISGFDAAETGDDEIPQLVADVQWLTWSYLRSGLYPDDAAWETATHELASNATPFGRVDCK